MVEMPKRIFDAGQSEVSLILNLSITVENRFGEKSADDRIPLKATISNADNIL